ncbi:uracil-DNA glycosylase family protein [Rhodospirillales bacterium]|nr:uracil-DNA glycosylase family protein [Rhodospirillales bacterium]
MTAKQQYNAFTSVLNAALGPCPSLLNGACRDFVTWDPHRGQVPRGWWGGLGSTEEIELVIVLGEPSLNTQPGESYGEFPTVAEVSGFINGLYQNVFPTKPLGTELPSERGSVHYNVMLLLQMCFGEDHSLDELAKRTWVTQAVLCSVKKGTLRRHHTSVRQTCWRKYLRMQLDLVPDAFIIPMGNKARDAVSFVAPSRRTPSINVMAAARPSASSRRKDSLQSWEHAAREFRLWKNAGS